MDSTGGEGHPGRGMVRDEGNTGDAGKGLAVK